MAADQTLVTRMGRLRLRQLEQLLTIARHGSLTGAAASVGATQPAMSQTLLDIEEALGVELFVRGRRLQPTPHLQPTLTYARRTLAGAGQLATDLKMITDGWAGRVRIGAMPVSTPVLVPRAIAALRTAGSQIEIEVQEDIASGLWPRLERHEIDLLIGRVSATISSDGIRYEALIEDRHQVCVGPHHPLLQDPAPTLEAAVRYPWTLPPEGTILRQMIDQNFAIAGVPPPTCWQETGSITLNLATIATSDCIFVTASAPARFFAERGLVSILPIRLERDLGPVGMAWRDIEQSLPLQRVQAALRLAAGEISDASAQTIQP